MPQPPPHESDNDPIPLATAVVCSDTAEVHGELHGVVAAGDACIANSEVSVALPTPSAPGTTVEVRPEPLDRAGLYRPAPSAPGTTVEVRPDGTTVTTTVVVGSGPAPEHDPDSAADPEPGRELVSVFVHEWPTELDCLYFEAFDSMEADGTTDALNEAVVIEHQGRLEAEGYTGDEYAAQLDSLLAPLEAAEAERRVEAMLADGIACGQ